ncbi:phage tail spike protein [Bacillus wiedmannii]|uniref:Phage tail spike protein n=1 Tax=Bacillus wiedmannii TaxID=1890302 RepID=A0AA95RUL9_9BACI|nr:phage tail spike protein [Bacillus wiedmannii]WHY27625.1 phage tail spike protein [Bacillus wiedmannii]
MRTPSGTLHVVDFKKSQIVSAIQPKDYWDDKRHWEIKNNIDTLEFRVFENTDHAATLVQQNLVLKEVRGGRIVPYVITEAEKDSDDKSLMVYASGEWIQLAKAEIIEPQKIESKTLKQCMEIALKGTKWGIGKTEHDGSHSMTIDEFTNPLDLLKKIAASFELEIQYRAEVVGSQIVVRYVDMVKKRGRDTRKEVTVGKDLLGIKRIENSQNICTALLGYVKKDNGEFITISEINNGVPYLVDDAAYQRWNEKGKHKFAFYTPQIENEDMSPQRLMTLMKTEMNKLVNTSVSYEVQAQSIGRVFGLAHELINEGDTIRIIDAGFAPKLYLEARAIAGDESFKNPKQDKYMFGDYREIIDQNDELRRLYQKILSSLYDKVPQELFDQLKDKVTEQNQDIINAKDKADQAQKESQEAKDLAEATVEYVEQNLVDIIESVNPPTANLKPNKTLWRDISGGKPGILKIWTGTTWEPVVPDTGPLQQSIKDVQKDIETTKTELNQKVQDAQNQATGRFNEVKESLKSVSRVISDVQNEQGNINKKVTQIEQTSDGFKTSIESLTKKDTEISNKLNTVEQDANGTKQTIERIETNMNNLQVGTTNLYYNTELNGKKNPFGWATLNADLTFSEENNHGVLVVTPKADTACGFYQRIGGKGINTIVPLPLGFYTVSLWVKGTPGMKVNITAEAATKLPKSTTMELTDEWIRHKFTFEVTTENNNGTVTFYCQGGNKGKVFYATKPQIERGKILSDYKKSDDNYTDTNTFIKVTSEIKTEAGKINEKLTEVTGIVNNLKPGGRNFLLNTDFKTYITNDKRGWDNALNGTLQLSNWQGEFNGGVQQPEKGYHAHVNVKKFGYPVLAMISKNSVIGLPGRWLGLNQTIIDDFKKGDIVGKEITISMDIWTESGSNNITGGPYHFIEGNTNQTFHSGQFSIGVDKMKQWVRYSQTLKLHDKYDVSKGAQFYIYGHTGSEGERYIKNVQIEIGNIATEWQPAPEENVSTDEFMKKTTEIEKSVDGVKTTITNVQKDQGTMQSTLNQVKQTTDLNSQSITTISQTQGKHGEIIQQNTSDITQLNNQIKSKVSDTQMQEYVGGLGSTNLLFNAAFEDRVINDSTGVITSRTPSVAKWGIWANGTNFKATPESARNRDGFNSVKLETTGLTANTPTSLYQPASSQANSGDHVFSAWFYTDNKALLDGGAYMEVAYYNGGTWVASKSAQLLPLLVNNSWVFVSVTLPAPAAAHNAVRGAVTINRNGRLWVSQPQLQKGQTPSNFMENPKDYANYDQLVGEIAKKVATSDFNNKVTQMETTINQQSDHINLKAEAKEVYTKTEANGQFGSKAMVESHNSSILLMADAINQRVEKGNIASTINQTAQSVLIQANKIYLDGYIEAKHLKAQTLQGVTIQTAPQGSGANQIRLNAQNMTLYGSNQARGYFGFINRSDNNITSALILGNDYAGSGNLNGSLVLDQTTISGNQWTNSVASIGVATGRSGNDILKSSYINFYRYDGAMQINSVGDMSLTNTNGNISLAASSTSDTTGFINLSASKDIYFTAKRGYFNFYTSNNKSFPALIIKDLAPNNQGDVDFMFANQLMLRVARHPDYVGDGIQIKNGTGTSWANMKLGVLRTMGNIGCDANVYAKNFINTSTRKVKTNIKDLPFSALKKVNTVRIKQYNLISDVEKYNAGEIDVLPINYGMIAEDTDGVFTTREKDAVSLYGSVSITMQAVQELDWKTDNMQCDMGMLKQELEAEKLEKVYIENQLNELKILVNSQEDRIAKLEELLLQQLINKKPEQP